jgi:hypothetical protein
MVREYTVIVRTDGTKEWYDESKLHREDGPAVEHADGAMFWYRNGKRHREDGPACEWSDGSKSWYLNGVEYTEKEFNRRTMNSGSNKTLFQQRVEKLAKQAIVPFKDENDIVCYHFSKEIFAELIVRECSPLAYGGPRGILEHFGLR